MFEFVLNGILNLTKDDRKKARERVAALKQRLIKIGYHPDEVEYLISSETDNRDFRSLNTEDLEKVEVMLKGMISIAEKALEVPKRG